jgi:hypothetical protein
MPASWRCDWCSDARTAASELFDRAAGTADTVNPVSRRRRRVDDRVRSIQRGKRQGSASTIGAVDDHEVVGGGLSDVWVPDGKLTLSSPDVTLAY